MYLLDIFDEREMNEWKNKATYDKTWANAKNYFQGLYWSKKKYLKEREARTSGFESAKSIGSYRRNVGRENQQASCMSSNLTNRPPESIVATNDRVALT